VGWSVWAEQRELDSLDALWSHQPQEYIMMNRYNWLLVWTLLQCATLAQDIPTRAHPDGAQKAGATNDVAKEASRNSQTIDVHGRLYAKIGDESAQGCEFRPFCIANTGTSNLVFDRIHVDYERQTTPPGDVIAQDYTWFHDDYTMRYHMMGRSSTDVKFPEDVQTTVATVPPGTSINFRAFHIAGNYLYRIPNPTTMIVILYLKEQPVSAPLSLVLPRRSELSEHPDVAKQLGTTATEAVDSHFSQRP
jgi:hypothetical protein